MRWMPPREIFWNGVKKVFINRKKRGKIEKISNHIKLAAPGMVYGRGERFPLLIVCRKNGTGMKFDILSCAV